MMHNFCNCMKGFGLDECEFLREPFKSLKIFYVLAIIAYYC